MIHGKKIWKSRRIGRISLDFMGNSYVDYLCIVYIYIYLNSGNLLH